MKLIRHIYIFFFSLLFLYPFSLLFSSPALANTDFTIQTTVNPSNTLNTHLFGVSNFGGNHAWAVGYYLDQNFQEQAIIESYNGSGWVQQTPANVSGGSSESVLLSVKALSATDIWAVGYYANGGNTQVLIEHSTDGGNTWTQDTDSYMGEGILDSIGGNPATDDAWAVGDDQGNPIMLHLVNGHFTAQSNINLGEPTELYSVSEYNNNDVWATGYYVASDGSNDWIPLSMHWEQVNGTYQWVVKTSPNFLNSTLNVITSVVDIGSNDAWAIEDDQNGSTLLMHWNGSEWGTPTTPPSGSSLTDIAASSSNNIMATLNSNASSFIWQTNDGGATWNNLSIEKPSDLSSNNFVGLTGITVDQNTGNAWIVGGYENTQKFVSVIESNIIQNNPPTVGTVTVSPNPVQINDATTATASFTDPAGGSTDTASWNWGDGSSTSGTVTESNGSGNMTDSHTYTSLGSFTVTLTVNNSQTNLYGTSSTVIAVIPAGGLAGGKLSHTNYSGADLSNQNLLKANLSVATFNNVNFQNANLSQVNGSNSSFINDDFTGANLNKVNLSNSNLTGSNFTNAIITQGNLSNANLTNVNFTGADLQGANLSGTMKTGIIWSNTICPNGTNSNNDGGTCIGQGGGL